MLFSGQATIISLNRISRFVCVGNRQRVIQEVLGEDWKVTGQEGTNVEIRKRKFRWIGHTLRKEDGQISKAALLWDPQGKRKRGRPRNSWRRSVIEEASRSWNELRFLAVDRQKWKGLVDNLCS